MRIELAGVAKRYGKVAALAGVDLDVPAGARVAVLGANGSGKPTLPRVVMGLVRHEGSVRLGGAPTTPRRAELAERIAYVPQVAPPWAAPVAEVVRAVASLRGVPIGRITAFAARLDLDLDRLARRPFRGLSGGTKQKVLIALALATAPRLAILDEPTASLDAGARARFFAFAPEAFGDATVLLCSHRLDELRTLVDHVVVLADGRVAWCGPAEQYLADHVTAVIELRVADGDDRWLRAHAFTRDAGGWWHRAVDPREKLELVPAALAALGPRVRDLAVRDAERVSPGAAHA